MQKKDTNFLLILGVLILLSSCQSGAQKPSENSSKPSLSPASSESRNTSQYNKPSERNSVEDKALAIQSLSASLKQDITKKPELKLVIERILSEPEKFNELAETCSVKTPLPKTYRTQVQFTNFLKLSDDKYILYLQCSTGAYQPSGVYFLFSNVSGIQTKPLKLTKLIGYESNHPKEVAISSVDSQSITGYHRFDRGKRELTLAYRCDGQWSCFSKSRYTVVNNQPVLQEYIVGNRIDSQDGRYTVYQFIRNDGGWISSGVTKCREKFACLRSRNE